MKTTGRSGPPGAGLRIISGGQTGADRAALDAALACGAPCGGWCPRGRKAEDGRIPDRYPLIPMHSGRYPDRTLRNVAAADATVVLAYGPPTGGSALTVRLCRQRARPVMVVDAAVTTVEEAVAALRALVAEHGVRVLNVAGPRASGQPEIYRYTYAVVAGLLAGGRRQT